MKEENLLFNYTKAELSEIANRQNFIRDTLKKILVYCRSENRSKQAAQKLADMGYENVL